MTPLDVARFADVARARAAEFAAAKPFPHVVLDDFLDADAADALAAEFAGLGDGWTYYHHVNERKRGFARLNRMGQAGRAIVGALSSAEFLGALETLVGVAPLLADPDLDGGGLHETAPGGFLNVHTDFLTHITHRTWTRRVNVIVFLNREWHDDWGGHLELWDPDERKATRRIVPVFNRCVIFRTTARSFHGVPGGVHCPTGRSRKSLALYYFRDEGRPLALRTTRYVPRPHDGPVRRALIRLDRWALYGYSALKRYTPLGDRVVSAILRRL